VLPLTSQGRLHMYVIWPFPFLRGEKNYYGLSVSLCFGLFDIAMRFCVNLAQLGWDTRIGRVSVLDPG
jgi:hypothetical protein